MNIAKQPIFGAQHFQTPKWLGGKLGHGVEINLWRRAQAIAHILVALGHNLQIKGQHQGTAAWIATIAISGIDIALWDLKGKVTGLGVLEMLGGPAHEKMAAIASLHGAKVHIEEMAEEISAQQLLDCMALRLALASAARQILALRRTGI